MIRIHKPKKAPQKLTRDGKQKCQSHCEAYSLNPSAYENNKEKFDFASSIYAHESVKEALIKAQHQKCYLCERIIGKNGDVEHFRPKGAYQQAQGEPLRYPAYYWLAYTWENLYLSCPSCNSRHKKNLFPLRDPNKRATNHSQRITKEIPLFIDCGKENPEDFIGFRAEYAYAIDGNKRGQITIDYLGLNSEDLIESRRQRLNDLRKLNKILIAAIEDPHNQKLQGLANEIKVHLETSLADSAVFAAAARCAIRTKFQESDLI
ncbi:MAG: hypothetical protein DCE90_00810 [Pseudanabaena sp.]|nr:MAG: hypothetical protein DCE90_00810 [Pseudanabaena sp.]